MKYYKSQGFKPVVRKKLIYEFCEKYITNFNRAKYYKIINTALNYGAKKHNNLICIENIKVTKNELDCILSLDVDYKLKKILFTLLVQNKINKRICEINFGKSSDFNFFGGSKIKFKEIKEVSKVPQNYNINKAIYTLGNLGIVEIKNRGKIDLYFLYNIENCEDVVLELTTFDDIGYYLDFYCSESNVIKCVCGKFIKKNNNKQKYCKDCAREINISQTSNRKSLK